MGGKSDPMNLPDLPNSDASLAVWQNYITSNCRARGWDSAEDLEIFLLFSEEVGEFAKALRRHRGLFSEKVDAEARRRAQHDVAEEMADVLSYLLDLASRLEVDLGQALLQKEQLNREREWD